MANIIKEAFDQGAGILHMYPNFIPVKFGVSGHRLKIHPNDYYAYGMQAGTVMERWLCAVNGARTKNPLRPDQGFSYAITEDGQKFLFKDAIAELGADLIGKELQQKYGTFPVYSKFFDYETPLYFHFHPRTEVAQKVGCEAKPECYYFPPQLNPWSGRRASTYFGFHEGVTKDQVFNCIKHFGDYDTRITDLSQAFNIAPGQGWYVPAGVIHAPGSLLTYEPQWCTDLNCVLENVVEGEIFAKKYMTDIVPDGIADVEEYIMDAIDWKANFEPDFKRKYYRPNVLLPKTQEGLSEKWVCYGNEFIAAKEVIIAPGAHVVLKDNAAYGCVLTQGFGRFGAFHCEAVNMHRIGTPTADEFFVSKTAANEGISIVNNSICEPLVILQHFGPDNVQYLK